MQADERTAYRMDGKTVVMTGATSGIGAVAAATLAARGARLVIVARDARKADRTLDLLRRANPAVEPTAHLADLSRLDEMGRLARAIAAAEPRVDVLANNAGAIFATRAVTADGLERTFATNHMSYVVLSLGLKRSLLAAGGGRVVNTASAAHRGARLDLRDMQSLHNFGGWRAYARSKLYNILFTRELARRWRAEGITVNCFHPGFVATRFGDAGGGWLAPAVGLAKLFAIPPETGALPLTFLASAPAVARLTGLYFERCVPVLARPAARDDAAAAALFARSLALADLTA